MYPVDLHIEGTIADQAIAYARYRQTMPDLQGYGLARHRMSQKAQDQEPLITINYLGQMSRANSTNPLANYRLVRHKGGATLLEGAFEIDLYVMDNKLHIEIAYDKKQFDDKTVHGLLDAFDYVVTEPHKSNRVPEATTHFGISSSRLSKLEQRLREDEIDE